MSTSEELLIIERLVGQRETIGGLEATAAATAGLGRATATYGREAETARKRSWFMNQALFTMRRFAYFGTLGLLGTGAAALKMGYDFNSTLQTTRVAMRPFFQNAQQMSVALGKLFQIAAFSPLTFVETTKAFRTMYPALHNLGIGSDQVVRLIRGLVNGLSVAGIKGTGQLNRVSVAMQHLANMGRLTGQVVIQLARDGIPIYRILHEQIGLTAEQIHNVGRLGIPSMVVFEAISKFLTTAPGYADAARRQSRTLSGAIATFKDFFSLIAGRATAGIFGGFNSWLNRVNDSLSRMTNGGLSANISFSQFVAMMDREFTPKWHTIARIWAAISDTWKVFTGLVGVWAGALKNALVILAIFLAPLVLFLHILAPLVHHLTLLRWILTIAIARILIFGVYTTAARIATWLWVDAILGLIGVESLAELNTYRVVLASAAYTLWVNRAGLATVFFRFILGQLAFMLLVVRTAFFVTIAWMARYRMGLVLIGIAARAAAIASRALAIATFFFDAALAANPIGLVVIGIIALTAAVVFLFIRVRWLREHWLLFAAAVVGGPVGVAVYFLVRHFRGIVNLLKEVVSWAQRAARWLGRLNPFSGGGLFSRIGHLAGGLFHTGASLFGIPGLQHGGQATRGGWSVIGEAGPELLKLPTGASVVPLTSAGRVGVDQFGPGGDIVIKIPVLLDGRQIAEVVAKHSNDWIARR